MDDDILDQEARDRAIEKAPPPIGPSDPPRHRRGFAIEYIMAARDELLKDVSRANLPFEGWFVVIGSELSDLGEAATLRALEEDATTALDAAQRALARIGAAALEGLKALEAERRHPTTDK